MTQMTPRKRLLTIPERRGIVKNDVVENHYLCKENIQFV